MEKSQKCKDNLAEFIRNLFTEIGEKGAKEYVNNFLKVPYKDTCEFSVRMIDKIREREWNFILKAKKIIEEIPFCTDLSSFGMMKDDAKKQLEALFKNDQ